MGISRRCRPLGVVLLIGLLALTLTVACAGQVAPTPVPPTATPVPVEDDNFGVYDNHVIFGQSAAFEGPARALGQGMRLGIEAAFAEANNEGGVHGRRLDLIALNDSYEPNFAISNTQRLINEDKVFGLIGEVGTPTSRSVTPIAAQAGVPFIGPFTGAGFLRDASWGNVINLRASYAQETAEMVNRLVKDLNVTRIGIMYQDDSFGRSGYEGVLQAMAPLDMQPVAVGIYERNTAAVKTALLELVEGNPQAVIMVGAYQPCSQLVLWARHLGYDWIFLNVSFVGSNALKEALGDRGTGVVVTQVVPFPWDESLEVVADYQKALAEHAPDEVPGFVSLEGYLTGRLAIQGLEACGRDLTRECFMSTILDSASMNIGGFPLEFGPNDNQGSDSVFLTVIGFDGEYHAVDNLQEAEAWLTN